MNRFFLFCFLSASFARGEVVSASSGLSISPQGVQITAPPTGKTPELTYDKGVFSLDFSVLGNGKTSSAGPVRILAPTQSGFSSALTDSDEFFRSVGKKPGSKSEERSSSGRPIAK